MRFFKPALAPRPTPVKVNDEVCDKTWDSTAIRFFHANSSLRQTNETDYQQTNEMSLTR